MAGYGAFSHKIDNITIFKKILNLKRHQNCITSSRVTAILLNGWIFPIRQSGEASPGGVCPSYSKKKDCLTSCKGIFLLEKYYY